MDQLIRLDPIRHALNDRLVHVKHIQQEQIGALTGRHLSIGNSKQHRLHFPDGFTYDNAPFTGPQSIKQIVFGNCEQLRSTTIQVTLMHPFSVQVPGPLPQPPCPVSYCTGGMPSSAIGRGGHTQVEFTLNCGLSKGKPSFRPFACVQCALECCASPAHFHIWYNTAAGISLLHPGKVNTIDSCTHTNRSTGIPSSNATQPGLCIFAASALARAKFTLPEKSYACCKKTDSHPPTPPSASTRSSTILPGDAMPMPSCAASIPRPSSCSVISIPSLPEISARSNHLRSTPAPWLPMPIN